MSKRLVCFFALMLFSLVAQSAFAAPCTLSPTSPSVTICTPASGATVASPVTVSAGTTDTTATVTAMAIYVNDVLKTKQNVSEINASIAMSPGANRVVVQAWDSAGRIFKSSVNITVANNAPPGSCSGTADPSVTICSPTNGSTVTSPVNFVAGTRNSAGVTAMAIYDNDAMVFKQNVNAINTNLNLTNGNHFLVAQSWDNSGRVIKSSVSITVSSSNPAPAVSFIANPTSITAGQSSMLSWTTTNASSVTISNGIGSKPVNGSVSVSPTATTTYTLTATGAGGTTTAQATVVVSSGSGGCNPSSASPSLTICTPADGSTVNSPVHIVAVPNSPRPVTAMAVYVDNNLAYKQNVSTLDTNINMASGPHTVVAQFWDNAGSVTKASVRISVAAPAPTITFTANPETISSGASSTLTWNTTNASSVSIDNGVGSVPTSGSTSVSPAATTTYTLTATGSGGTKTSTVTVSVSGSGGSGGINNIEHIIFMLQENRSFDNYFGMLNVYRAQLGLPQDVDAFTLDGSGNPVHTNPNFANNGTIRSFKMTSVCTTNLSPAWNETHVQANRFNPGTSTFLNDGFVFSSAHFAQTNGDPDVEGLRSMGYYDWTHLPYYYFMASQFAISDRFFTPAPTATNVNRHYLYAGTSEGHAYPWTGPISDRKTIFDLLSEAGITWKIYVASPQESVFNQFSSLVTKYQANFVPIDQYFTDVANGTLPQVATLETSALNEHPDNNIQLGAEYVKRVIDALMGSQYWQNSAFFLTYDEAGGLYDHVKPVPAISPDGIKPIDLAPTDIQGDFTMTGFRIPLLVVSPYAKPHYVSHTTADFTAILKFIEKRFGLASLTARDAAQIDMTEFFDFTNKPWATPPQAPPQPIDGSCYFDHLP
jgi:phospholipase C